MEKNDVIVKAYQMWHVFDEWTLVSGLKLTAYEKAMFQWLAIFGASQDPIQWNDLAPDEVHSFIDDLMNGVYPMT